MSLPDGYTQISPRGSMMVFDNERLAMWERSRGAVTANLRNGAKLTVFLRKRELREAGILPRGGIARFYGTAEIHESGPIYDEVWARLIEPEKKNDADKQGFAVLIKVDRAEDLEGKPLGLD